MLQKFCVVKELISLFSHKLNFLKNDLTYSLGSLDKIP